MKTPTIKELQDAGNISQPYASMILTGKRNPSRALAITLYRKTDWKHPVIQGLSAAEINMLERIEGAAA